MKEKIQNTSLTGTDFNPRIKNEVIKDHMTDFNSFIEFRITNTPNAMHNLAQLWFHSLTWYVTLYWDFKERLTDQQCHQLQFGGLEVQVKEKSVMRMMSDFVGKSIRITNFLIKHYYRDSYIKHIDSLIVALQDYESMYHPVESYISFEHLELLKTSIYEIYDLLEKEYKLYKIQQNRYNYL